MKINEFIMVETHVADTVDDYLNEVNFEILDWPPRSPDLNSIEHLWEIIVRQLRSRQEGTCLLK